MAHSSLPATAAPDIILEYEQALCPELTLHTDIHGPREALDALLQLALRLHRVVTVEAYRSSSGTLAATC